MLKGEEERIRRNDSEGGEVGSAEHVGTSNVAVKQKGLEIVT